MVTGSAGVWLALALGASAGAHPMHTAVLELVEQGAPGSVSLIVRVFADDFGAAVPARSSAGAEAYLRHHIELRDAVGRAVELRWAGATQSGDVVEVRFAADVPGGLSRSHVRATILCERFTDQVNIVRATYAGRTASLLFTPGDQAKALP